MHSYRLQTRRGAVCSLMVAAATSVCVLGSTVMLFEQAGRTPVFEPGSKLAAQAAQCPYPLSQPARRECLRDIASEAAARRSTVVVARSSASPSAASIDR